jgi:hypothetical protein
MWAMAVTSSSVDGSRIQPHDLHDSRQWNLEDQQHGGVGVSGVTQPGVSDVGLAQQRLPALMINGRMYRSAEG